MRRLLPDKAPMEQEILSVFAVFFFCVCCHQFIKTVVTPIPLLAIERPYARAAMQLEKFYKSLAWGIMTGAFLVGLIVSFRQIFISL